LRQVYSPFRATRHVHVHVPCYRGISWFCNTNTQHASTHRLDIDIGHATTAKSKTKTNRPPLASAYTNTKRTGNLIRNGTNNQKRQTNTKSNSDSATRPPKNKNEGFCFLLFGLSLMRSDRLIAIATNYRKSAKISLLFVATLQMILERPMLAPVRSLRGYLMLMAM
jgi:hypothetical protein